MAIYEYSIMVAQMTSDTAPSPLVASSGGFNTVSTRPWNAFDRSSSTYFASTSTGTTSIYLQIDLGLGNGKILGKYKIVPSSTVNRRPRAWTVQGSNDNSSFVTIDTQNFSSTPSANVPTEFTISNLAPYRYYRLNVTNNEAYPDGSYSEIAEWELQALTITYENKILLKSFTGEILSLKENKTFHKTSMTASNSPSPFVAKSSGGSGVGYEAYKAFNGLNVADTDSWRNATNIRTGWVSIDFSQKMKVNTLFLSAPNVISVNAMAKDFTIEGSNDEANWISLASISNQIWDVGETKSYTLEVEANYRYFRINVSATYRLGDGSATTGTLAIGEILFAYIESHSVIKIPTATEQNFIKYGLGNIINFDTLTSIKKKTSIESNTNALDSGKIFTHSLDLNKRKIYKINL